MFYGYKYIYNVCPLIQPDIFGLFGISTKKKDQYNKYIDKYGVYELRRDVMCAN